MKNLRLAYMRCARGGSQIGVVVFFIALMQLVQFLSVAFLPVMQSQLVEQSITNLSQRDRWITVTLGDASQLGRPDKSALAVAALQGLTDAEPLHYLAYRPVSDKASGRFQLVAVTNLASQVRLLSGRLPQSCSATKCEVVALNTADLTKTPPNLVITGMAELSAETPMRAALDESSPVLLTDNIGVIAGLPSFAGFPATESWATPLTYDAVYAVGLDRFIEKINTTTNDLAITSGRLQLVTPLTQLDAISAQIDVLRQRLASLGLCLTLIGTAAVLLLAGSGRARHEAFLKSAKRLQSQVFSARSITASMALIFVSAGTAIGLSVGGLVLVLFGDGAAAVSTSALQMASAIAVTSGLAIVSGLESSAKVRRTLVAAVISIWAGVAFLNALDPTLAAIAIGAALVSLTIARATGAVYRDLFLRSARHASRRWIGATALSAAFMTSALLSGSVFFSTLEAGALDSAVFLSPPESRLKLGGEATVMELNTLDDYKHLSGSDDVFAVRKIAATLKSGTLTSSPAQLVGVDARVWDVVPNLSHQTGIDLRKSGDLLPTPSGPLGINVTGGRTLSAEVSGLNSNTYLSAWVLNTRDETVLLKLAAAGSRVSATLPADAQSVLGFEITELPDYKDRREHAVGEGINGLPVPTGRISITNVAVDDEMVLTSAESDAEYSLINGPVYLSQVSAPTNVVGIVDAESAASAIGGSVWINIGPDTAFSVRVVEVADALPTVPMRFVLLNPATLTQMLAATHPELMRVAEVWSAGTFGDEAATAERLAGLTVLSQSDLLALNLNPLNVSWTRLGFGLLGLTILAMYAVLVWFAARVVLRDEQIFGWAASQLSVAQLHRVLQRHLFTHIFTGVMSAAMLAAIAMPLFVGIQRFDFNGALANPPLVVSWHVGQLGVVLLVVLSLSAVLLVSAARGSKPTSGDVA